MKNNSPESGRQFYVSFFVKLGPVTGAYEHEIPAVSPPPHSSNATRSRPKIPYGAIGPVFLDRGYRTTTGNFARSRARQATVQSDVCSGRYDVTRHCRSAYRRGNAKQINERPPPNATHVFRAVERPGKLSKMSTRLRIADVRLRSTIGDHTYIYTYGTSGGENVFYTKQCFPFLNAFRPWPPVVVAPFRRDRDKPTRSFRTFEITTYPIGLRYTSV